MRPPGPWQQHTGSAAEREEGGSRELARYVDPSERGRKNDQEGEGAEGTLARSAAAMLSVPARRRAPDGAATAAHPDARAVEVVARLDLADHDLARRTLAVRRGEHTHVVHLDDLSTALMADWPRERRRHWPQATDPHLLITSQSYRHPASPQIRYCAMRAAFDQIGLLPRQVRADRILDKARATADPVHLVRIFGIHPSIAVKYVHAAHPDNALLRIR
ncbi:hypothetical protein OHA71_32720 [Streptomyces sp. NBC_00444]|uniref:hypothetical protein n=1 Tax=Streptomyces sp. NBC_00444 TaxID=2975744 RepID=UPI002E1DA08C